jgi:hypothetical protein
LLKVCNVPAISTSLPRILFSVAINSTNETNKAGRYAPLCSLYCLDVFA